MARKLISYNGKIISNNGLTLLSVNTSGPFTPFSNDYSFDFDGTDDYVNSSYAFTGNSDFTISFWVKGGTSPGTIYPGIFPISIGTHSNSTLGRMHPSSGYKFMIQSTDNNGLNFGNRIINIDIWDGNWYHIAFKRVDSTGQLFAYVNGVNVDWTGSFGSNTAPSITLNPSGDLYFGAPLGNTSYAWSGELDEVSVFDSALSSGDISAIYNNGTPTDLTSLNPVAWYRMGDNGSYKSPQWLLPSNENKDKVSNYSMSFDGTNDYIDCGNIPEIKNNTEMTLSFWAKIEDLTFRILFGQNLVAGNDIFQLYLWGATPALYVWIKNGGTGTVSFVDNTTLTSLVSVGEWNHFTLVFNGSLSNVDRCKLFINGGGDAITNRGTMPTAFPNSDEPFLIGRGTNGYFQGNIDNVAVWGSDQSANVSTIYNGGVPSDLSSLNPINYYKMGENAIYKSPQWLIPNNENKDKFSNYSMSFDGTDDYIEIADADNLSFGDSVNDSPFSVSVWTKLNSQASSKGIFSKFNRSNGNAEYGLVLTNADQLIFRVFDISSLNRRGRITSAITSNFGNWVNIVCTYNGVGGTNADQGIKIYLNGVRIDNANSSLNNYVAMHNLNTPFNIGNQSNGYVQGNIDEVAVFNSELSQTEVTSIYNGGKPKDLSGLSPISWWRMGEEATFSTNWNIPDQVGSNDGTSSNMDINDRVGDAPGSSGNTVSFNMDINDRIGEAPNSENNALSYNMVLSGRTTDVPI